MASLFRSENAATGISPSHAALKTLVSSMKADFSVGHAQQIPSTEQLLLAKRNAPRERASEIGERGKRMLRGKLLYR